MLIACLEIIKINEILGMPEGTSPYNTIYVSLRKKNIKV